MANLDARQKHQFSKGLQARGVFAVHCQISDEAIDVGILVIDGEEFERIASSSLLTLFSTEDSSVSYRARLPKLRALTTTKITLERVYE